jgi:hypothetical protein
MSGKIKVMSCSNHRGKLTLTLGWVSQTVPKWTETTSASIRFSRKERRILIRRDRLGDVAGDACRVQGLGNPPLTIAATGQGEAPCLGKAAVVDISGRCTARHDRFDWRRFIATPALLGDLAAKIVGKPFFRSRKPSQIMNRQRLEAGRIERARWTRGT